MKNNVFKIVIIGGGPSGISTIAQLDKQLKASNILQNVKIEIYLVEKNQIGGLAFGGADSHHICNTQKKSMGVYIDNPYDFENWLKNNWERMKLKFPDIYESQGLVPRSLYAIYLEDVFNTLKRENDKNILIRIIRSEVVRIRKKEDLDIYKLDLDSNETLDANFVVVAIGNDANVCKFDYLKNHQNFISSPYNKSLMNKIPRNSDVAIIGTSLSGIDIVLTQIKNQHLGHIYMTSRNGLLPGVQNDEISDYEMKYLTVDNIQKVKNQFSGKDITIELWSLFENEVMTVCGKKINWEQEYEILRKNQKAHLKFNIRRALRNGHNYQKFLYKLSNMMFDIWDLIPFEDRSFFLNKLLPEWRVYKHPMPLVSAIKIEGLMNDKRLDVIEGFEHNSIIFKDNKFTFQANGKSFIVDYMIDSTGGDFDIKKSKNPLIHSILNDLRAISNSFGGFQVNDFCQIIARRGIVEQVYTLGSLTVGDFFYIHNVRHIVVQADKIAHKIVSNISENNSDAEDL